MSIGGELSKILNPEDYKLILLSNNLSVIEYNPSSKTNWCLIDWGPKQYRLTTYIEGEGNRKYYKNPDVSLLIKDVKTWMQTIQ
ncbi:MAG: hypothetical protein ACOCUP_03060 [bacterium]